MSKLEKVAKNAAKRLAELSGYRLAKSDEIDILNPLLTRQLNRSDRFFFIQIGGNDGKSFDPIFPFIIRHRRQVEGIVLEPMRDVFNELAYNYRKCPGVKCVNRAIHNSREEMLLYRVDPAKASRFSDWTKGIASFDPDHHKRSGIPSDCIITEVVRCISFGRLLDEYSVKKIDLLQIDTEGYDVQILMEIDFEQLRPSIIHFEHGLGEGTMTREAFQQVSDRLHQHDYQIFVEPYDATAYQLDVAVANNLEY